MSYVCVFSSSFPRGTSSSTIQNQCTIFPPSKPDHSLIYPISLNWDRILHAILDRVIFDSPTPHPITQRGFSSFLPITCLILLFHCYHYCLGSYIYVIFCLGLLIFVTKHPPRSLPTTSHNTTFILPSLYSEVRGLPTLTESYPSPFTISPRTAFPFLFLTVLENKPFAWASLVYSLSSPNSKTPDCELRVYYV